MPFNTKGVKANNTKKKANHNGINPTRNDTKITMNIASTFAIS